MKYRELIERVLTEVEESEESLAKLLRGVDALDRSVPTLEKLNEAFVELKSSGNFPEHDWRPVNKEKYNLALAENREWMMQMLEKSGISHEKQEATLETYKKLWGSK